VQSGKEALTLHEFELPVQDDKRGDRYSICGPGDLDGDGKNDIVIGTPFPGKDGEKGPRIFLREFSGGDGHLIRTVTRALSLGGFGFAVVSAPDTDGDGVRDLWVSRQTFFENGLWQVSSRTGNVLKTIGPPHTETYDFGWSLATGADVDGDGVDDVIVGDYSPYDVGNWTHGAVVLSGSDGRTLYEKRRGRPSPVPK
jgi:hypothetical protein